MPCCSTDITKIVTHCELRWVQVVYAISPIQGRDAGRGGGVLQLKVLSDLGVNDVLNTENESLLSAKYQIKTQLLDSV